MQQLNISTLFTLKYPFQNQYNTKVCHIIGCLVFLVKLFRFILYFNPTIVNEKATDRPKFIHSFIHYKHLYSSPVPTIEATEATASVDF